MNYSDKSIPGYIEGSLLIPKESLVKVNQIKVWDNGAERSTITFSYPGMDDENILYNADPNCDHEIQAQWSGIKCIKCGGWYCA